ncbi:MAG: hypothetical protein ABIF88_02255 [archaeon]
MDRIRFLNKNGQKEFLNLVIEKTNSPSLRGILQFGFSVPYSTLKNYYKGIRLIPGTFFEELLEVSGISRDNLNFEVVKGSWGQVMGGKKGRRRKV